MRRVYTAYTGNVTSRSPAGRQRVEWVAHKRYDGGDIAKLLSRAYEDGRYDLSEEIKDVLARTR